MRLAFPAALHWDSRAAHQVVYCPEAAAAAAVEAVEAVEAAGAAAAGSSSSVITSNGCRNCAVARCVHLIHRFCFE